MMGHTMADQSPCLSEKLGGGTGLFYPVRPAASNAVLVDLLGFDEVLGNPAFRVEQLPQLLVDRALDPWGFHHDHAELAVAVRAVFVRPRDEHQRDFRPRMFHRFSNSDCFMILCYIIAFSEGGCTENGITC